MAPCTVRIVREARHGEVDQAAPGAPDEPLPDRLLAHGIRPSIFGRRDGASLRPTVAAPVTTPLVPEWLRLVSSPVCDPVGRECVGVGRVVAYAEGEIGEYHSSSPAADLEHHAELASRRWKIDLDTSVQPRSVLRFAVACEKIRDGATVSFVDATRLDCDGTSGIGGASQILAERQRVEDDRGATRLCSGHLLTVAVGWPDGPVLLFEFRDRGQLVGI